MSTKPTPAAAIENLANLPPAVQIMNIVSGAFVSQAAYVAAKLGIADILAEGPRTAEYIAVATQTNEDAVYRVLRALSASGVFIETEQRTFANTPASDTLRTDHPESTRDITIWMGEPEHWKVYGGMIESVRTGKPAWDSVHGEPVFKTLFETDQPLGDIFNRAMTSFSHVTIPAIIEAYDFSNAGTVADIAGGYGHLLGAVLKTNPGVKGVLFELPHVLEGAPEMMESYGVADRVEYVAGSFTESIPVAADIYFMKHIIHDWYDYKNEVILRNIREQMSDDAKLLIFDAILPEGNEPHFGKVLDLEMLVSPGGKERTAVEFEALLARSGLKMTRIIETKSPVGIVEAVKA